MLKKTIGIYTDDFTGTCPWDENKILNKGAGGSETWAALISIAFSKKGYHVMLFGLSDFRHFSKNGVEYIPYKDFPKVAEYQHFDYFIYSRVLYEINEVQIDCDFKYAIMHDSMFLGPANYESAFSKLKGISVLSEPYVQIAYNLYKNIGITKDKIFITSNGVDASLYEDFETYKKENCMLWSTAPYRGLQRFLTNIFPRIKKEIPDFKIKVATYALDDIEKYSFNEDCVLLGCLSKDELAKEQKKSKIWVYPNIGWDDDNTFCHETFCITALENAMAGNAIICMNKKDGIDTTLKGYYGFIDGDLFDEYSVIYPIVFERVYQEFADKAIKALKNEDYRKVLAHEAKMLASKYTWDYAADLWIKRWKEDEEKINI